MTSNPIIQVRNLHKNVLSGTTQLNILKDINLEIQPKESVAVVGVSGSGKTTLLSMISGLDTPSEGEVRIVGQNITELDEDGRAKLRGEYISIVFQTFQLLPNLNALENVMLPLEIMRRSNAAQKAKACLEQVGLGERAHHYPKQLSGGEQQRVAIARAFVVQPKILFADEPTGNLDQQTGSQVINLLFDLNKQHNTTLVVVTHDEELAKHCDRLITLDNGQII